MSGICVYCFTYREKFFEVFLEKNTTHPISLICSHCLEEQENFIKEEFKTFLERSSFCEIRLTHPYYNIRIGSKFVFIKCHEHEDKVPEYIVNLDKYRQKIYYCIAKGNMIGEYKSYGLAHARRSYGITKTNCDKYGEVVR